MLFWVLFAEEARASAGDITQRTILRQVEVVFTILALIWRWKSWVPFVRGDVVVLDRHEGEHPHHMVIADAASKRCCQRVGRRFAVSSLHGSVEAAKRWSEYDLSSCSS